MRLRAMHLGYQNELFLGNLDSRRDWGHARDYVEGMWRIMQHSEPDDFVLATGEEHSVREFVECAFAEVGRRIVWRGAGVGEVGVDPASPGAAPGARRPPLLSPDRGANACWATQARHARSSVWRPHRDVQRTGDGDGRFRPDQAWPRRTMPRRAAAD